MEIILSIRKINEYCENKNGITAESAVNFLEYLTDNPDYLNELISQENEYEKGLFNEWPTVEPAPAPTPASPFTLTPTPTPKPYYYNSNIDVTHFQNDLYKTDRQGFIVSDHSIYPGDRLSLKGIYDNGIVRNQLTNYEKELAKQMGILKYYK